MVIGIKSFDLGSTINYGIVTKYTQFLIGRVPKKNNRGRENGEFYDLQLAERPMTDAEIIGFGCWLELKEKEGISKAETINRLAAAFRDDPEYETLVRQAGMALRVERGGEAAESVSPDLPAALDAEKKDHSADIQSRLQRVSERMTR